MRTIIIDKPSKIGQLRFLKPVVYHYHNTGSRMINVCGTMIDGKSNRRVDLTNQFPESVINLMRAGILEVYVDVETPKPAPIPIVVDPAAPSSPVKKTEAPPIEEPNRRHHKRGKKG